ncbi:MAG TPA: LysR family transcriptional regulator [Bacilli bacterium]
MNLHALRLFSKVAERASITRAAEEMNISQPAVTSQIKKLEQEIGLVLLVSKGRGIILTEAGLQLARQAKRLFSLEIEIESHIDQMKKGTIGKLRITATFLPANFLLPRWISLYKQTYKEIEIELTSTNANKAIERLVNYEAELAFIGGSRESHPLIARKELFEDELWFVVHKDHKLAMQTVSLAETLQEPFVFREEGSSSREMLIALCRVNNTTQPALGLQMNGLNETIRAVMEGYGVTFVSALEVKGHIGRGELARVYVEGVHLKNPISLCTRKRDALSTQAHQFTEMVMNSVFYH